MLLFNTNPSVSPFRLLKNFTQKCSPLPSIPLSPTLLNYYTSIQTSCYFFYLKKKKVSWSHFSFNYHPISLFPFTAKCLKIFLLIMPFLPFFQTHSIQILPPPNETAFTKVTNNLHMLRLIISLELSFYWTHHQHFTQLIIPFPCKLYLVFRILYTHGSLPSYLSVYSQSVL